MAKIISLWPYILADRMEFAVGKKLPLWMAGLVY